jgi:endonuclease/exonuclease/phosphatase family metal-dependent hydrolase
MEEIRFKGTRNIAIFTDILVNNDTIRVFNVHLQSYGIDPNKYSIMESPIINEGDDIREVKEVGLKVIKASMLRAKQARVISEYVRKSPYPVIVCGDFNDTPVSFTYQKTRGELKDSFVQSGKGFARTFIGKLPSFRIDYILHSRVFRSYNYKQYNLKLSDHIPITCDLKIK